MEQDAERVDVRRWRGDDAAEPFGSVVGGRREGDDTSADLVEAEVCDVAVAVVVEQHVLRAQAPVYQAVAVGGSHPGGDRLEDRQRVGRGEPAAWDARREVAPADQTADHHRPIRFAPVVEQRDQRRVLGPGDPLRGPLEAADEQRVDDDAGIEEAHRHLATDRRLVARGAPRRARRPRSGRAARSLEPIARPAAAAVEADRAAAAGTRRRSDRRRAGRRRRRGRARRCRSGRAKRRPTPTRRRRSTPGAPTLSTRPVRGWRRPRGGRRAPAAGRPARRRRTPGHRSRRPPGSSRRSPSARHVRRGSVRRTARSRPCHATSWQGHPGARPRSPARHPDGRTWPPGRVSPARRHPRRPRGPLGAARPR